jgi:lipopolysaccharide/colanic/teichoic acid biosynthesis glycosyltransferase
MTTFSAYPVSLTLTQKFQKRIFDFVFSSLGLLLTWWLILLVWIVACIDTRSNGFFVQKRVGRHGKIFRVVKIKTMRPIANFNTSVTCHGDPRITILGVFFRHTKIDELPQLWNVLIGQMSFVGPRPDVRGYADRLQGEDRIILSIRPGITGPAQLAYKNEEEVLANQNDAVKYNDEIIWPDKVRINRKYIEDYSFFKDFYYIWKTIVGGNVKY